jgi:hypothetical protein
MWMAGVAWRLFRPDGCQSCAAAGRLCDLGGSSRRLLRRLCIRALQLRMMGVLGCIPCERAGRWQGRQEPEWMRWICCW